MITSKRIEEEFRDVEGLDWISALRSDAIKKPAKQGVTETRDHFGIDCVCLSMLAHGVCEGAHATSVHQADGTVCFEGSVEQRLRSIVCRSTPQSAHPFRYPGSHHGDFFEHVVDVLTRKTISGLRVKRGPGCHDLRGCIA